MTSLYNKLEIEDNPAAKPPLGAIVADLFGRLGSSSWATLLSLGSHLVSWGMVVWLKLAQQKLQAEGESPCPACPACLSP